MSLIDKKRGGFDGRIRCRVICEGAGCMMIVGLFRPDMLGTHDGVLRLLIEFGEGYPLLVVAGADPSFQGSEQLGSLCLLEPHCFLFTVKIES